MATIFVLVITILGCIGSLSESKLVQDEVDALRHIISRMGLKYWRFDDTTCQVEMVGVTSKPPSNSESSIECDCQFGSQTCHVISLTLKGYSLSGVIPPELVMLPHLQHVDFAYNYLSGTIPSEWASMQLKSISVLANRLSGEIPKILGDMTSLTYLNLEANYFSGNVPRELGNLINLETLILSSNRLTGPLPTALAELNILTDFRINDNNLSGPIPHFIQNWKRLARLEMHASGLEGPIPSGISYLLNLTELRISDIHGTIQGFPVLSNMTGIGFEEL
ncbi:hypothetical protein Nepgr_007042 [Nepenthes gracilis]|uniref:Uncharacterized protein n=1 Tax=Nepenthes gracilis TaxID=150966 RepID=A0AAD3XHW7_NEPGR|nr:hypothetical protein Nepgr_007042 [Nepenthes gracilis]